MTTKGEILAAFVTEEIPRGLSPQETIQRLRDQGAFISVSHPFELVAQWGLEAGRSAGNRPAGGCHRGLQCPLHRRRRTTSGRRNSPGSSIFPARPARMRMRPLSWEKPGWCCRNSIGPDELRKVIRQGQVKGGLSPFWVHFASFYARWRKMVV